VGLGSSNQSRHARNRSDLLVGRQLPADSAELMSPEVTSGAFRPMAATPSAYQLSPVLMRPSQNDSGEGAFTFLTVA
jgi:hypothetical protein